jgi:ABC-type hemin transport system ATPase subunit
LQAISSGDAVNPFVALYDIHGRKREVLFILFCPENHTRQKNIKNKYLQIVLVDEATANLDQETERLILETLRNALGGATVVYVAHRQAGVRSCARVLALAQGRVRAHCAPHELDT